jgi:CBS domain-containing protein
MNRDSALPVRRLEPGTSIVHARPPTSDRVTLDSPALAVMTDLTQVRAAMIAPGATLAQAEQTMIVQGVRMLFVVSDAPGIEGLITTTDLRGERPMRVVQARGLHHDEITVADAMTPLTMLDAIDFDQLRIASVGNLVATLKQQGRNHLLVVDGGAKPQVRGIVSRAQIERQLGQPVEVIEVATSFAELGRMLA